ncbi:MAG: choice-of-anchor D domain-containing protein [Leptothrix sp. (in: b-proteobacteria)]
MTSRLCTGLALCALAWLSPAQAQSVSNGRALYQQVLVSGRNSCSNSSCHSISPGSRANRIANAASAYALKASFGSIGQMTFLNGRLSDAEINDISAYVASATGGSPTFLPVASATGAVTLSSRSVDFGSVQVATPRALSVALNNSGRATLNVGSITSTDPQVAVDRSACPAQLAIDASCTLTLTYTPTAATALSTGVASLTLNSNAPTTPDSIALAGSGSASPTAVLDWAGNPGAQAFKATLVGSTSAATTLTLQNHGTAAAALGSGLALAGTDASEFALSGSCVTQASLAAGASCDLAIALAPSRIGAKAVTLQARLSGSSYAPDVALSGTALDANTANTNVGGGGCTLGRTESLGEASTDAPNTPIDPLWWLMLALAAGVLTWRRLSGAPTDV